MKREIRVWDYAEEIMKRLETGILLTSGSGQRLNTMAISWGMLGIEWSTPVFTVFVRENRFTRQLLDENPEFTINVPRGAFDRGILGICGTRTGRDTDKFKAAGLTPEAPRIISVPGIREFPLTLECRVIYRQKQDPLAVTAANRRRFYPPEIDGSFPGDNRDYHTAYYGEIVASYLIE